jgi:hypothetical protein
MSNDEAKFILHAYRASGRDANDPQFAQPLTQAKHDPALGRWFERQQAYDATIAAKLRAIEPPAHLRDSILAGMRAQQPKQTRFGRGWRLALAVAAVAVIGIFAFSMTRQTPAIADDQFVRAALDDLLHGKHGGHGAPTGELQQWLGVADHSLTASAVPIDYEALRRSGCRALTLGGREVLEVCFSRGGPEFHLYIAKASGRDIAASSTHMVASADGQGAAWSARGFEFAVVTRSGVRALQTLL